MLEILKEYGINEDKLIKFEKFKNLLKEWNGKFNLTSILDDKEIEIKHFLDSVKGEKYFTKNANVVEVGSGGGFPSIPLMIVREDLNFTLIESTGKKCEFLKFVINELNLNGKVFNIRAEDAGKSQEFREKFDIVTARAVARLNTLSEYCIPLIKKGGLFIAYKGEDNGEEIESQNAFKLLGAKHKIKDKYLLFNNENERTIHVIEKIENTPSKYPRGNGKERSKPLWLLQKYPITI